MTSASSTSTAVNAASMLSEEFPSWMLVQQNNQEMLVFMKSTDPRVAQFGNRTRAGSSSGHLEEILKANVNGDTESVSSGRSSKASSARIVRRGTSALGDSAFPKRFSGMEAPLSSHASQRSVFSEPGFVRRKTRPNSYFAESVAGSSVRSNAAADEDEPSTDWAHNAEHGQGTETPSYYPTAPNNYPQQQMYPPQPNPPLMYLRNGAQPYQQPIHASSPTPSSHRGSFSSSFFAGPNAPYIPGNFSYAPPYQGRMAPFEFLVYGSQYGMSPRPSVSNNEEENGDVCSDTDSQLVLASRDATVASTSDSAGNPKAVSKPKRTWFYRGRQVMLYTTLIIAGLSLKNPNQAYHFLRSLTLFVLTQYDILVRKGQGSRADAKQFFAHSEKMLLLLLKQLKHWMVLALAKAFGLQVQVLKNGTAASVGSTVVQSALIKAPVSSVAEPTLDQSLQTTVETSAGDALSTLQQTATFSSEGTPSPIPLAVSAVSTLSKAMGKLWDGAQTRILSMVKK
ncbi:hypothetical protein HDV05_007015 [Chytridiales sp. JEL 0842]|nr:hypothetical protein HDV05_007015 [Chytridiales sp. JEL 0842]